MELVSLHCGSNDSAGSNDSVGSNDSAGSWIGWMFASIAGMDLPTTTNVRMRNGPLRMDARFERGCLNGSTSWMPWIVSEDPWTRPGSKPEPGRGRPVRR